MGSRPIRCIAIMGATATGKTDLAVAVALAVGGEVISMDSRQVYRGFDIGTAKATPAERARVPHHLVDILDPDEPSAAGRHAARARETAHAVAARGRVPLFAGGTGLYFRALFHGLAPLAIPKDELARIRATFTGRPTDALYRELETRDPPRAAELSPNDRVRITRALEIIAHTGGRASEALRRTPTPDDTLVFLKLVLTMPRARLRARIEARTRALFDAGWPDEVKRLRAAGVFVDAPAMKSLGYAEIAAALERGDPPQTALDGVVTATRQYAKRQETFFRGERDAVWIDVTSPGAREDALARVEAFLGGDGPEPAPQ